MISMNWRPPRLIEASSPARLPAEKARIRNRSRWNSGSLERCSISRNRPSRAAPPSRRVRPGGWSSPWCAAVGLDAVGDADQHGDQPDAEGEIAGPVDAAPGPALADLAQLAVAPDGPEDAEGDADQEHRPPVG